VIERELAAIPADFDAAQVALGSSAYHWWCGTCHGPGAESGGVLPDLRKSDSAIYEAMDDIVLRGVRIPNGMPRFDDYLDANDVAAIRAYLLTRRAALLAEGDES
jgi:quinohemoprotein ethanol dehydrogenase